MSIASQLVSRNSLSAAVVAAVARFLLPFHATDSGLCDIRCLWCFACQGVCPAPGDGGGQCIVLHSIHVAGKMRLPSLALFTDFFCNSTQAKAVYLHPKEFSVEAGELTPTQKLVRRKIEVLFATQIEEMYKSLP